MLNKIRAFVNESRKAVTAGVGLLALVVGQGLLPSPEDKYATAVLAALTALGVYTAKNDAPSGD